MSELRLDGRSLTVEALARAATGGQHISLAQTGLDAMQASRELVDRAIAENIPVYGVTTGLGARASEVLDEDALTKFSEQTIHGRAHAVGDLLPAAAVRATLLARLNSFLTGHSGARPEVVCFIRDVLNAGLVPVARGIGSIGAGDLVVNATVAWVLLGEGQIADGLGGVAPAQDALEKAGLDKINLAPRDGLALINHTGFSAGTAALALADAFTGFDAMQAATALYMEGFRANLTPLDSRALSIKPLPGQTLAAQGLNRWLSGSALWQPGQARRLQDPLSIRNAVHISGGLAAALEQARSVVEIELNSAGDNPVALIESDEIISCGAYHTTELGLAIEHVNRAWVQVAMAQVARIARMMEPDLTGLPLFLARADSGSNGFAPALKVVEDLAAEIAHAAMPAQVWPSINARGVEDCITPAPVAIRALARINDLAFRLTAAELIVATQAVELRGADISLGEPMRQVQLYVRSIVAALETDHPLGEEIENLSQSLAAGHLRKPG